jgi:hypothetical protein
MLIRIEQIWSLAIVLTELETGMQELAFKSIHFNFISVFFNFVCLMRGLTSFV